MKNSNISDTTDNSENTNDIDDSKTSDTTTSTEVNIPDDVSDSDTIIQDDDDENNPESRSSNLPLNNTLENIQDNVPHRDNTDVPTVPVQPSNVAEISVNNPTDDDESNAVAPVSTPATAVPDPPLSEYEIDYVIQMAAAAGIKIGPQQVPAFLRFHVLNFKK